MKIKFYWQIQHVHLVSIYSFTAFYDSHESASNKKLGCSLTLPFTCILVNFIRSSTSIAAFAFGECLATWTTKKVEVKIAKQFIDWLMTIKNESEIKHKKYCFLRFCLLQMNVSKWYSIDVQQSQEKNCLMNH